MFGYYTLSISKFNFAIGMEIVLRIPLVHTLCHYGHYLANLFSITLSISNPLFSIYKQTPLIGALLFAKRNCHSGLRPFVSHLIRQPRD